jgi:RimJ/RimL family protein N-acetyltransferase
VLRGIATDGVVTLRRLDAGDAAVLIAGRDDEWRRWLGPRTDDPTPLACIIVEGEVVGWVDYDTDREWLEAGEVNIGYNVFADHRPRGYASRAVDVLIGYIGRTTPYRTATLLINPENIGSVAVAAKLGCEPSGEIEGTHYFKRSMDRKGE